MLNRQPDPSPENPPPPTSGGWNTPALVIGIAIMLVLSFYPRALAKPDGTPDMLAAAFLFWAMSAGFVRGLGFVPRLLVLRLLLSLSASLIALAAAVWRLASA
jgi:predicted membrane protein